MKKMLVVVDYQVDFVDGAAGFEEAKKLEMGIYEKIKSYQDEEELVVFTYDTHGEQYLKSREGRYFPIVHCIKGSKGHELYGKIEELKDQKNTMSIEKRAFGFSPKTLYEFQKDFKDIEEIEIVGIVTNMCVLSNAVLLQNAYKDAEIKVDASLCASFDRELHEKALDVLESIHIKILNRN